MRILPAILMAFTLAACSTGEVRESLGLNRDAPDEFKVVSRPPLSVPPEFTLRPPDPGAPPRLAVDPEKEASRVFLKEAPEEDGEVTIELVEPEAETAVLPISSETLPTSGESRLMDKFGVEDRDPEIRNKLYSDEKEAPEVADNANITVLDQLLGTANAEPVVDPFKEAERLRQNKDEDKPLNEGEVEVLDPANETVIDKLF